MRILWHSNAPWTKSGYGIQTNIFGPRIKALGHEIAYSANWGLQGGIVNLPDGTQVLPSLSAQPSDYYLLPSHANALKVDIVITLYDIWTMPASAAQSLPRWVPWAPIDFDRVPEHQRQLLNSAWHVIAYSRYGQERLQDVGFDAAYVPHGLETATYHPIPQDEARTVMNLPTDRFIALMVSTNHGLPSRKSIPEILCAWKEFSDKHDDVLLYLHTHIGRTLGGVDINTAIGTLDIKRDSVITCDPYNYFIGYSAEAMANLFNSADVLVLPSHREAFGVPLIEAQACGCPVIVSDYGPMPELCFAGWKVGGQRAWTSQNAWEFQPFISDIYESLEQAYQHKGDEALQERAVLKARAYDADIVVDKYWRPVLEDMSEVLEEGGELEMVEV